MNPETLKRLEELNENWANESLHPSDERDIGCEVMDHLPDLIVAVKERDAAQQECAAMRDGLAALKDFLDSQRNDPDEVVGLINAIRLPVCAAGYHKDCPETDGTDAAHPAWWRGHESGAKGMAFAFQQVLEGKHAGTFSDLRIQAVKDILKGYHPERDIEPLVRALNQIRHNQPLCATDGAALEQALAHWEKVKEL